MNFKNSIHFLFWTMLLSLSSYAQVFEWATSPGGTESDYGRAIATDQGGNVITGGDFEGAIIFGEGNEELSLSSNGSADIFIQKRDSDGNLIWVRSFGSNSNYGDVIHSITLDAFGNTYAIGEFKGIVDLDPGMEEANFTASGDYDIYILKLDPDGNYIWARTFGGSSEDNGRDIMVDTFGNLYVTGYFFGSADFDPGANSEILSSEGYADAFVLKLNSDGEFIWARSFGGAEYDYSMNINVDATGAAYTTGYFSEEADFNPGEEEYILSSQGSSDVFVHKLDSNGTFQWAKSFGGFWNDDSFDAVLDDNGDLYVSGTFSDTVDFDPGEGTFELNAIGSTDAFIQKLSSEGELIWVKGFGGQYEDVIYSICMDDDGGIYTIGDFEGTVDFDPGEGVENYTALSQDIFIQKLNSVGEFEWARPIVGQNSNYGIAIATDNSQNIFATGFFAATADFDPNEGSFDLTAELSWDTFVLKWSSCNLEPEISVDGATITALNSDASFRWLDCNNNFTAIEDEIGQSFTAINNGSYAVEVTQNGCVATSECVEITAIGVLESSRSNYKLYPNPAIDYLTLEADKFVPGQSYLIYDQMGREVQSGQINTRLFPISVQSLNKGVYMLRLEGEEHVVIQFVKS